MAIARGLEALVSAADVFGRFTSSKSFIIIGAVTMKMTKSTKTTSTKGVMLMSLIS
jgi:hypothetical protein